MSNNSKISKAGVVIVDSKDNVVLGTKGGLTSVGKDIAVTLTV
ncbi:hypothetical protein [Sutcliffiella horikoshii]